MGVLDDLLQAIREGRPELETETSANGQVVCIAERGRLHDPSRPQFTVEDHDGAVVLDRTWRLPVKGEASGVVAFVLDYVTESLESHGWDVPVRLEGGPRHGLRVTKRRDDLVGRLLFARAGQGPTEPARADVYKWRLRRAADGDYLCLYERSLVGEELDHFLARGVEDTGPFVLIPDLE